MVEDGIPLLHPGGRGGEGGDGSRMNMTDDEVLVPPKILNMPLWQRVRNLLSTPLHQLFLNCTSTQGQRRPAKTKSKQGNPRLSAGRSIAAGGRSTQGGTREVKPGTRPAGLHPSRRGG
jgi:hypothetical protein